MQNKALSVANEIMNVFNKGDPSSVGQARKLAEEVFGEDWEKKGAAIYDEGPKEVNVWGIGDDSRISHVNTILKLDSRTVNIFCPLHQKDAY